MYTSSIELNEINELITYKMRHTYLNKYVQDPVIDRAKLTALSTIVNNTSLLEETKKQYIIATMLVQSALDTHDLIPITNHDTEDDYEITSKQLTVLAGDYFSGLYYLLLSETKDIDMISVLASAIKEITEYKMKLYYMEVNSFSEYLSTIQKIETLLITRVADFLNNSITNDVMSRVIITSKLIEEKNIFPIQGQSLIIDNWLTFSESDSYTSILLHIDEFIRTNINQIEELLAEPTLRASMFHTHFQYMLDAFIYKNISVVEEG